MALVMQHQTAPPRRSSTTARSDGEGIRQRVNHCMSKLSDRDTEAMAASELDAIARSISPETFQIFISAISDSRPTDRTPLRCHPLRVLSILSSHHPAAASLPHLPRMLAAVLRRIRDPDTSVRAACVEAVRSMAASHPSSVTSILIPPLADSLIHEQDRNAQSAAALCLAAAVDAAASDRRDLSIQLQRMAPRLVKLLRSNAFKAKPSLISLLGSSAGAGGASSPAVVAVLVPCLAEFLGSGDWAARKAAADALSRVALSDPDLLAGFRASCLPSFESRKFDKVKIVRDSMKQMLEVWKDIPMAIEESGSDPSSGRDAAAAESVVIHGRFNRSSVRSSSSPPGDTAMKKKKTAAASRSPPPEASPITAVVRMKKAFPAEEVKKSTPSMELGKVVDRGGCEGNEKRKMEARRALFEKVREERKKSAPRVAPVEEAATTCSEEEEEEEKKNLQTRSYGVGDGDDAGQSQSKSQRGEDMAQIRAQLHQIQNQQNHLLDLLQKFMGSSQDGICSLEARVRGLETALDGVMSSSRRSNEKPTCWWLPGAEFLSSKFRKRRVTLRRNCLADEVHVGQKKKNSSSSSQELCRWWDNRRNSRRIQQGRLVVNPLADIGGHGVATGQGDDA